MCRGEMTAWVYLAVYIALCVSTNLNQMSVAARRTLRFSCQLPFVRRARDA